jgi:putative ABC transport system ATP-binding protein
MTCLRTESLGKTYAQGRFQVEALKSITLSVEKGEFLALAGPSGSGKTTLLNLIGALDYPSTGKVFIEDQEITGLTSNEQSRLRLNKIGFVFQEFNLIPVLSAIENVEYVMLLQGIENTIRREKALQVLKDVGLAGLEDRRPGELSGGQQQRVAVARAIVTEPALVLADEPTANLDSETGEALLDLMQKLNADKQVTFVLSTHDPIAIDKAQRVIRIRDGKLDSSSPGTSK